MKRSISTFLIINLLLYLTVIIILAIVGDYYLSRTTFRQHLDSQLSYAGLTIQALVDDNINSTVIADIQTQLNQITREEISKKITPSIQFEVLNKHDKLILHSSNTLSTVLPYAKTGFGNCIINHKLWRTFVTHDPRTGATIIVGEPYSIRAKLAMHSAWVFAIIMLIFYPFFGLLIWLIVGRGLASIRRVTTEVRQRAAGHLQTVDVHGVPNEIRPLVDELNELFIRLQAAFQREKRFAADAAHELKTPLAALRTQTQVAINAIDKAERDAALQKTLQCVDRSTHIVQQLLTLSRMVPEATLEEAKPLDLKKEAVQVIAELVPAARKKDIDIELIAPEKLQIIMGYTVAIDILLRNLIDNAIRYTPNKGSVQVIITESKKLIALRVIDSGPGIPEALKKRVFERFYRIVGTDAQGSGLGFSIVHQIVQIHKAKIRLTTPKSGKGLEIIVVFYKPQQNKEQ